MIDIFEEIDKKFDLREQIHNLSQFLQEECFSYDYGSRGISFEEYFDDKYFRQWKYFCGCSTLEEFKIKVELENSEIYNDFEYKNFYYYYAKNEVDAIKYLQYAYNATEFVRNCLIKDKISNSNIVNFYKIFENQFNYILSKIGQQVVQHSKEDYYLVVPCNDKTKQCASIQTDKNNAFLLYEYTSSLYKGNIEKKREILRGLAHNIEGLIQKGKDKSQPTLMQDICNTLGSCLNNFNIRHNNIDSQKESSYKAELEKFTNEDWEEIYDATYDLILDVYLLEEYQTKTKKTYEKFKEKAKFYALKIRKSKQKKLS